MLQVYQITESLSRPDLKQSPAGEQDKRYEEERSTDSAGGIGYVWVFRCEDERPAEGTEKNIAKIRNQY